MMNMTRRKFFAGVAAGTAVLTLNACGGGDDGGSGPGFGAGCTATGISGNHGHTLAIAAADLSSQVNKTYSIRGTADHDHSVTFTPAQLTDLFNGNSVVVTSTAGVNAGGSHTHTVTTRC